MINKEQVEEYIEMRNSNSYNVGWFYGYFCLMQNPGKQKISFQEFNIAFQNMDLNVVLNHLDRTLPLYRLYDKLGQFVRLFPQA